MGKDLIARSYLSLVMVCLTDNLAIITKTKNLIGMIAYDSKGFISRYIS